MLWRVAHWEVEARSRRHRGIVKAWSQCRLEVRAVILPSHITRTLQTNEMTKWQWSRDAVGKAPPPRLRLDPVSTPRRATSARAATLAHCLALVRSRVNSCSCRRRAYDYH